MQDLGLGAATYTAKPPKTHQKAVDGAGFAAEGVARTPRSHIFEYGQSGALPLNNTAQPPRTAAHAKRRICNPEIGALKIGNFERGQKRTFSKTDQKAIKTAQNQFNIAING